MTGKRGKEQLLISEQKLPLDDIRRVTSKSIRKTQLAQGPDEPLVRIEMVPANAVPIVCREGMVIVVIPFAGREEGKQIIIDCRLLLRVRPLAPVVRERVDEPCQMMQREEPPPPREHERAQILSGEVSDGEEDDAVRQEGEHEVMTMLEHEQFALQKIRNVSLKIIALRLFQYPKDVRVPKTFVHGVRIVVGIEEAMMHTVIMGPRKQDPFKCRRTERQE